MKLTLKHAIVVFGILPILAACGGGGGDTPAPVLSAQEQCEADGGRWNADDTCTSAADLEKERQTAQRTDISMKIAAAETAVAAVNNDSTDDVVFTADNAIAAARTAIANAADLPAEEKAANTGTVNALASRLTSAKSSREMAMDDAQRAADIAMAALAAKLLTGISAPNANAGVDDDERSAEYSGTSDADISVTIGTASQALKATKKSVAGNHGWEGKQYMASGTGVDGTYEAVVYSDVGAATQGRKFGNAEAGSAEDREYEYVLMAGALTVTNGLSDANASKVAFTGVTRTSGTETFKLPKNNVALMVPGSFHGVSGTYSCTPVSGSSTCSATVAENGEGFTLSAGGDTWTFIPSDPNARVTDVPDLNFASYGWWLHTGADGDLTASAFVDNKGTAPTAITDMSALNGTATYRGGAAGQYALSSTTGGTNDAGAFTARAMLEADFAGSADGGTISGTIDNFTGADGEAKDWSVELKETDIGLTGAINGPDADSVQVVGTIWTIGDRAADADGQWSGALQDLGDDLVPKVATGTFYSTYGTAGSMVGAFGANKDD